MFELARTVAPETLDALPADDPRAVRSRGDLRRIHVAMGTTGVLARALREALPSPPGRPLRLLELGAGDGRQMLAVAIATWMRRRSPRERTARGSSADRASRVSGSTVRTSSSTAQTRASTSSPDE